MSAPVQPRMGFAGKRGVVWVLLASWLIPAIMTGAYVILILTSEVGPTGAAWEAIGLAFVYVLWFLFRMLTEGAAMARAVSTGDSDRVLELADFELKRRRRARGKEPYLVYRALACEMRDDWKSALVELDKIAEPRGTWRALGAAVRTSALAETGRVAEARVVFDAELAKLPRHRDVLIDAHARLADARLRAAEGDRAAAAQLLARLSEDIRAGESTRARAKALAAQLR